MIGKLILISLFMGFFILLIGSLALAYMPQMTSNNMVAISYSAQALILVFLALPIGLIILVTATMLKGKN